MTQKELILNFIEEHGSITPMDAFDLGITKLATRISEMKRMGYEFTQTLEHTKNRYGKTCCYMRYGKAA